MKIMRVYTLVAAHPACDLTAHVYQDLVRSVSQITDPDERASPFALDRKGPGCIRGFCIFRTAVVESDAAQSI